MRHQKKHKRFIAPAGAAHLKRRGCGTSNHRRAAEHAHAADRFGREIGGILKALPGALAVGDDLAFSHSLNRMSGTLTNGRKTERWLRWTACFRKTNDTRLIVHEQVSVPVDVGNGTAVLDLKS